MRHSRCRQPVLSLKRNTKINTNIHKLMTQYVHKNKGKCTFERKETQIWLHFLYSRRWCNITVKCGDSWVKHLLSYLKVKPICSLKTIWNVSISFCFLNNACTLAVPLDSKELFSFFLWSTFLFLMIKTLNVTGSILLAISTYDFSLEWETHGHNVTCQLVF